MRLHWLRIPVVVLLLTVPLVGLKSPTPGAAWLFGFMAGAVSMLVFLMTVAGIRWWRWDEGSGCHHTHPRDAVWDRGRNLLRVTCECGYTWTERLSDSPHPPAS